jgi:tripartite-type tricarboxylate transporter receptor subunit TctC
MITKRRFLSTAASCGLASGIVLAPPSLQPARPQALRGTTRVIIGFPPGGPVGIVARLLVNEMKDYATTMIVENRPGAAGRLALEYLKTSAADGSVFLITPASMIVMYPHVYKSLGYDPQRDFLPVTTVCSFPLVFAIGPMVPAEVKTLADFVAWSRANPKKATYGSPSAGSVPHFMGTMFARAAGIELLHVPYNGTTPAMQDLLGGEIAANITVLPAALPFVQAGKIRALATTGPTRNPLMPEVPTFVEAGFRGLESVEWFGVFVPAKTPSSVVTKLNHAIRDALKTPSVIEGLGKLSLQVAGSTPAELAQLIRTTTDRWGPIVKASGFTPQD